MKHSSVPASLSRLSRSFLKNFIADTPVLIEVDSPSLVSFVLSSLGPSFLVICEESSFDDVYSSFGLNRPDVVGVPFLSELETSRTVVKSYRQELYSRSSVCLSSGLSDVKFCVADSLVLKKPIISVSSDPPHVVGGNFSSFESLSSFLKKHNYKKVDSVSDRKSVV